MRDTRRDHWRPLVDLGWLIEHMAGAERYSGHLSWPSGTARRSSHEHDRQRSPEAGWLLDRHGC